MVKRLLRAATPLATLLCAAMAPHSTGSTPARTYGEVYARVRKIPAFARKYGLRCSACHTVWPELTAFGQRFKDNGYQLGNDRDSPIWQSNGYWPIAIRTTPQVHLENTTHQPTDAGEATITQVGFDLSGVDFLMLGTLYKNITFGLVPTLDPDGTTGLEAAFVRFDNLGNSPWANVKVGKFELDNLLSEKRFTWLSNNGGFLYAYHYQPAGSVDNYVFGLGDNQIGAELSGHSLNSYTRYSVSLLATDDGEAGLSTGKGADAMVTLSQAWAAGSGLGPQRVGVFGYLGHRPTTFQTSGGDPIPGTASDFKSFVRVGATAQVWIGNLELLPMFSHAYDDEALGGSTQKPTWNTTMLEAHYVANPRLLVQGRFEMLRNSKQADPATPKTFGDADAVAVGFRALPFMFSRDGMAFHGEFAMTKTTGMAPLSGNGTGVDALTPDTKIWSRSLFLGFDFAF
ncbi:MAG: hypothetical protein DMD62_03555 [Gemmatimonadetes bacterium]|nr:MAG: hypothetical protein DMD62_03555 [Gemmatimonadota bacterium]